MLAHREAIFCFIYKFRQRFAVVAAGIGDRLGVDTSALKVLREFTFYLDDLSCCDDACVC
jgi:putative flavoprotein involved in K+ transport